MIFEASDEQTQKDTDRLVRFETKERVPAQGTVEFKVMPYSGKCRIKVVSNLDETATTLLNSFVSTEKSSINVSTIEDFKKLTSNSDVFTKPSTCFPLCSADPSIQNGINKQTNLTAYMERIYARIDVKVDPSVANFKMDSVYLHRGHKIGRFEPYAAGEFPTPIAADYSSSQKPAINNLVEKIYLHENLASSDAVVYSTTLIVRGTFSKDGNDKVGYYKVVIEYLHPDLSNKFDYNIRRNKRYTLTIKKVKHYGYLTREEALLSRDRKSVV